MRRVTEWISELWKSSDDEFEAWLHSWCLEDRPPKLPTKAMQACYDHWIKFKKENNIVFLKTERKVMYDGLYHGTYDAIVEWDGMKVLLDLKFWQCWYWAMFREKIPTELKLNSTKVAKANFQTYCYNFAQHDYEVDARCVIAINPLGLQCKIFGTSPKKKFEEELQKLSDNRKYDF